MGDYSAKGFYVHSGSERRLKGNLLYDSKHLEGKLEESSSRFPEQAIKGNVKIIPCTENNACEIVRLAFFKIPKDVYSSQLVFILDQELKKFEGDLSGKYVGRWNLLKVKLTAYENLDPSRVERTALGVGDYAELVLMKK